MVDIFTKQTRDGVGFLGISNIRPQSGNTIFQEEPSYNEKPSCSNMHAEWNALCNTV